MSVATLVIGLGKSGVAALNELAYSLPVNLTRDGGWQVPLLALDWQVPTVATGVAPYSISGDAREWLRDVDFLRSEPDLRTWFDAAQYGRQIFLNEELDVSIRQLGRLQFLYHIDKYGTELRNFLRRAIAHYVREDSDQHDSSIVVHLLASLDDSLPRSALVDIINVVYVTLAEQSSSRIVLHLAFPQGAEAPATSQNQAHFADAFATLQELKRFVVSYGYTRNTLYRLESRFARWNAYEALLVYALRVYHQHDKAEISLRWADILLPLLDTATERMGDRYAQDLANWRARSKMISRGNDEPPLVVSTYEANSVIFPLVRLQRVWAAQLALHSFEAWQGSTMTLPEAEDWLLDLWLSGKLQDPNGSPLQTPTLLQNLYRDRAQNLPKRVQDLRDWLMERDDRQIQDIWRDRHQKILDWSLADVPVTVARYGETVLAQVQQRYGALGSRRMSGMYYNAWLDYHEITLQRWRQSIAALVRLVITDEQGGFATAVMMVEAVLLPLLQDAQRHVERQQRDHTRLFEQERFEESLPRLARRAETATNFLGRLRDDARRFQTQMTECMSDLQYRSLLSITHLLLESLSSHLRAVSDTLRAWQGVLDGIQATLQEQYLLEEQGLAARQSAPNRYWLYDADWARQTYQTRIVPDAAQVAEPAHWTIDAEAAILHDADLQITRPDQDIIMPLVERWLERANASVASHAVSLWDDYLKLDARLVRVLPPLVETLSWKNVHWGLDAPTDTHYLLLPTNMDAEADLRQRLDAALREYNQGASQVERSLTNTRIIRWTAHDGFLIQNLPEYQHVQQAYNSFDVVRQAAFHTLRAEIEAKRLQSGIEQQHALRVSTRGDIVVLLSERERIEQFLLLQAFGYIRQVRIQGRAWRLEAVTESYALRNPPGEIDSNSNVWWLPKREVNTLYEALNTFLYDDQVQTGVEGIGLQALPHDHIAAWLDQSLQMATAMRTDISARDHWQLVQRVAHFQPQSRAWAFERGELIEQLRLLKTRYEQMLTPDLERRERELRQLCVILLRAMLQHQQNELQNRLA